MSYEKKLAHLKHLTTTEKEFAVSMTYFFDELVEDVIFDQHSKPRRSENELYKALLESVIQQHYGDKARMLGLYLMEIKDKHFVHGSVPLTNGSVMVMYFFSDILLGMAATPSMTGHTHFFRLNAFSDERKKPTDGIMPTNTAMRHH